MKSPKKFWMNTSRKRRSLLLIFFLCFTCVTLVVLNGIIGNKVALEHTEPKEQMKKQESITEEVTPVEEVTPDLQTEFFSKEEGKALLYYAVVNDSVRFFKTQGVDPVTGQELLPVTKKIVDLYKESIAQKEKLSTTDTREYKVNEMKIIKKEKKKPTVKKKPKRASMWNTKLINSSQVDEISLFVFDESDEIDSLLTQRFKKEFDAKNYFVTPDIIYSDMLTPVIIDRLKNSDINYFEGNLKTYTDYVCIGIASYSYKESTFRNDFTDCTLQVDYFIYDAESGEKVFAEQDKLFGSGQNKKLARQDAVGKFVL
jgi:hypothetical protein